MIICHILRNVRLTLGRYLQTSALSLARFSYNIPFVQHFISDLFPTVRLKSISHAKEWEKIYGEFDTRDYHGYDIIGLPNETGVWDGEFVKWSQDIVPPPNKVLLAGEKRDVVEHLRNKLAGQTILTAGLSSTDYEWNFENDPPLMGQFDLIISQAVLEHLLNPYKHVCDLVSILSPGGVLILNSVCPDFMTYHRYPIDACRFYPDWFEETAKRLGLSVLRRRIRDGFYLFYMYQK
jgi:SAM-dependent methyltransferase